MTLISILASNEKYEGTQPLNHKRIMLRINYMTSAYFAFV